MRATHLVVRGALAGLGRLQEHLVAEDLERIAVAVEQGVIEIENGQTHGDVAPNNMIGRIGYSA